MFAQVNIPVLRIPRLLSLTLFCLAFTATQAADLSNAQKEKLRTAQEYVKRFLEEDANPKEVYFQRKVAFPVPRDYPLSDCGLDGVVRAIEQRGEARFERKNGNIMLVPVVAELIMVNARRDGGPDVRPGVEGKGWCAFKPEVYNFSSQRFEPDERFGREEFNVIFKTWGEYLYEWRPVPLPPNVTRNALVAIDKSKRYIRYDVRIRFESERPHRTWPQIPRFWKAPDAIAKLERTMAYVEQHLAAGISTGDPSAQGDKLQRDLQNMRVNVQNYKWEISRINMAMEAIRGVEAFSDINFSN